MSFFERDSRIDDETIRNLEKKLHWCMQVAGAPEPGGAQALYGVKPDLTTMAKIVSGGLPGGCVGGREEIVNFLELREGDADWNSERRVSHQGTFNANPVSAAAGIAAGRVLDTGTAGDRERGRGQTPGQREGSPRAAGEVL